MVCICVTIFLDIKSMRKTALEQRSALSEVTNTIEISILKNKSQSLSEMNRNWIPAISRNDLYVMELLAVYYVLLSCTTKPKAAVMNTLLSPVPGHAHCFSIAAAASTSGCFKLLKIIPV